MRPKNSITLASIDDITIDEGERLEAQAKLEGYESIDDIEFQLVEGPEGATMDSKTGAISWSTAEQHGPNVYCFRVRARTSLGEEALEEFIVQVSELDQPPVVGEIADVSAEVGKTIRVSVQARDPDLPAASLHFALKSPYPSGATIDAHSGELAWTPSKQQSGQSIQFTVIVRQRPSGSGLAEQSFNVAVSETNLPITELLTQLRRLADDVHHEGNAAADPFSGECHSLSIDGEEVLVYHYVSPPSLADDLRHVSSDMTMFFEEHQEWNKKPQLFRNDQWLALYQGENEIVLSALARHFGPAWATGSVDPTLASSLPSPTPLPTPMPLPLPPDDPEVAAIMQLYDEDKLFRLDSYAELRKIFASRFARLHDADIKAAFGEDVAGMMTWLDEHEDIKEELFTAINPQHDNVQAALRIFKQLKDEHAEELVAHGELAIATCVTWDDERRGIYDYRGHQRRAKATLPDDALGAADNFIYMFSAKSYMQGRERFLPWEFQTLVVDHSTPLDERKWSLANYVQRRTMFGSCYKDVPYDHEMLETKSKSAKLNDKVYTLANLRQFGGVCAHQADYAARVGKSIGVPSAYVGGMGRFGGAGHAWVMWVELVKVTPAGITFSLESHGRYQDDNYYVGNLRDPHTGQQITDRQLEMRLHAVGISPHAKRHADRLMSAYTTVSQKAELDTDGKVAFLNNVLGVSAWNEQAWAELSKLAIEFAGDAKNKKKLRASLNTMYQQFAPFPDFTWTIFDDMIAFEDNPKDRIAQYLRLRDLYAVGAKRPDLASVAVLRLAEILVEQNQLADAARILGEMCLVFPNEGRFVPPMLNRMEQIYEQSGGKGQELAVFYANFLPQIDAKRGSAISEYCLSMHDRGSSAAQKYQLVELEAFCRNRKLQIQAGK